ncbi:MAG: histidine kinase [Burkholderiales bacterium PBB5]|nr:MAG: histidine kinase [Burkholderiales bacterium PBB5]
MTAASTTAPASGPTSDEPGAPTVLDAHALAELAQLDPTGANRLVQRVFSTYITSLARLMGQLTEARAQDDQATIRLVAHTLKSSSASVGALLLSSMCAAAELAVRNDQPAALPALLDRLQAEAARVDTAVRQQLSE